MATTEGAPNTTNTVVQGSGAMAPQNTQASNNTQPQNMPQNGGGQSISQNGGQNGAPTQGGNGMSSNTTKSEMGTQMQKMENRMGNTSRREKTTSETRTEKNPMPSFDHGDLAVWGSLYFVLASVVGTALVWSVWNGLNALKEKIKTRCCKKKAE